MMRLLTTPYAPAVLDSYHATTPEYTAWLITGQLQVGSDCVGGLGGVKRGTSVQWDARVTGFELTAYQEDNIPRMYALFTGVMHTRFGDVDGQFGIPLDQFVLVP